ncbi:MAG: thiamine pyrophosphate-dependent dehydrogenase E1 component subunit alpha [Bauldia sp.]|uniref:thiamine pyrophosphate-dependent dehydrogenase E1 component subunit alpha n=1 Tax=Bauldia sp. TaxID=2575872 RepID=UPI001DD85D3F|nr:thiamine pyrophosphate-dependent dehydrogenase E1 component subunit alpha [Bauldia sp.]MCB1495362.1 thiamine pyrophosphate-dependent dehydrogenase E1 component subunit alpha [Bauldia sp.]
MISNAPLLDHYTLMWRMRAFEEACLEGFKSREIHGELHTGIGQEGIAAGIAPHLRRSDGLVSTHRNHLHALAKGVDPSALMAEIFEKETGLCRGRGGHMHPFDTSTNFSATGIVGASLPVALGYAYGFAKEARDDVGIAVTGDGGVNHGTFHECLNMAAAWRLPLVILVENNSYAISVPASAVTAPKAHWERAAAYGAKGWSVDGTDVAAVDGVCGEAIAYARAGNGPVVVEAFCHRFRGHYEGDADSYRPRAERNRMRDEGDPITKAEAALREAGLTAELLDRTRDEARAEMGATLEKVRADAMPDASTALAYRFVGEDAA